MVFYIKKEKKKERIFSIEQIKQTHKKHFKYSFNNLQALQIKLTEKMIFKLNFLQDLTFLLQDKKNTLFLGNYSH